MKHVQENLHAFEDNKFFNALFEAGADDEAAKFISKPGLKNEKKERLSPAERRKLQGELEKQGMSVVKKCATNFNSFKKHAGDVWQEYRDLWEANKKADESVQQKGMFYNMWDSDYIVGVVKEPNGSAALKVFNTGAKEDEYVAFECKNEKVIMAFKEFIINNYKATMQHVIETQRIAMENKKMADEKRAKDENAAAKKARLDAFLGESEKKT